MEWRVHFHNPITASFPPKQSLPKKQRDEVNIEPSAVRPGSAWLGSR